MLYLKRLWNMSKSSHLHGTWIFRHKELLIIIIIKIEERSLHYHRNKIYMHKNKGYEERRKLRHLFQVKYHFKVLTLLCLISKKEVFWKIRCFKLNQPNDHSTLCLDSQFPFFIMSVSDDFKEKTVHSKYFASPVSVSFLIIPYFI